MGDAPKDTLSLYVSRSVHHPSLTVLHKIPEIEDVIDHIGILLNNPGEALGVFERHRQFLVERVVIPIHFCEPENAGAGVVPSSCSRKSFQQQRGRNWFEIAFLVDWLGCRHVDPVHATL